MLTFAAAVFFLIITPGPGVFSTAGPGAAFGARPGTRDVIGLCIGTNLVALAVVRCLTALLFADQHLRTVLCVSSACYPGFLALRIALAGRKIPLIARQPPLGVTGAILLHRTERAINIAMALSMLAVVALVALTQG
jgi:threonine/homoserine/homoserine lactone efflux protein